MAKRKCNVIGCEKKHDAKGFCSVHYQRNKKYGDPLAGGTFCGEPIEFLMNAIERSKNGEADCIEWPYGTSLGYGAIKFEGKVQTAHRLALVLSGVDDHPGMDCCHEPNICHNRRCVNINHLRFATRKENCEDMILDRMTTRGEKSVKAKLTEDEVRAIRKDTRVSRLVAHDYGVTPRHIRKIKQSKTWAWLE